MTTTAPTTNDLLNSWQDLTMDDMTSRAVSLSGQLAELAAFRVEVEKGIADKVADMRSGAYEGGRVYSWAEVGAALGISKQAAQQRYGH